MKFARSFLFVFPLDIYLFIYFVSKKNKRKKTNSNVSSSSVSFLPHKRKVHFCRLSSKYQLNDVFNFHTERKTLNSMKGKRLLTISFRSLFSVFCFENCKIWCWYFSSRINKSILWKQPSFLLVLIKNREIDDAFLFSVSRSPSLSSILFEHDTFFCTTNALECPYFDVNTFAPRNFPIFFSEQSAIFFSTPTSHNVVDYQIE